MEILTMITMIITNQMEILITISIIILSMAVIILRETIERHDDKIIENEQTIKMIEEELYVDNYFYKGRKYYNDDEQCFSISANMREKIRKNDAVKFCKYIERGDSGFSGIYAFYTTKEEAKLFKNAIDIWNEEANKHRNK